MTYAAITGWGSCMPPAVLSNDDLSTFLDTSDEWIASRTGMKERRVSHVTAIELSTVAASRALACAGLDAADLDLVIYGGVSNEELCPNSASGVQLALGATKAAAIDLNGRVARMTNTQSAFGEQYDSLADVISFGAAPAVVVYSWALKGMGNWGWLAAFIYVAGAALRLARFNTNIGVVDKRFFQGLPSPAAAALVAGFVWIMTDLREARWITAAGTDLDWLAWIVTVYAGLTMVSNSPFYSFKDINFRRSVPFIFLILLVLGFVLISSDPPLMLFSLFVVYGLSGHVLLLWRWSRGRQQGRAAAPGTTVQATPAREAPDRRDEPPSGGQSV